MNSLSQSTDNKILFLLKRSYLVTPETKEKVEKTLKKLPKENKERILLLLQKECEQEKKLLSSHIKTHPEFLFKIDVFIKNKLQEKEKQNEEEEKALLEEIEGEIKKI